MTPKEREKNKIDKEMKKFLHSGGKVMRLPKNKYYIYFLIDPRDKKVFYIGKGQKERMYAHERIVKVGKSPNNNFTLKNKIKDILDSGNKITYKQVWFSDDEKYIYKMEKFFIKKYKDLLTNIAPGGGRIRKKFKKRLPKSEFKKLYYKKM